MREIMRHAFLVAYEGSNYYGFVRQPGGVPTVESVLLGALKDCGIFTNLKESRYQIAARTDRGVGALAQVLAMNTLKTPEVEEINSRLPEDVVVLGVGVADKDFNPRRDVVAKHYKYVCEVPENFNVEIAKEAASMLVGKHDFRFFCAREKGKTTEGKILLARVDVGKHLTFDFVAPAFLRQQVRRMVQALLEVGIGVIDLEYFSDALNGKVTRSFRPAPPEGLFLANITYRRLLIPRDEKAVERFVSFLRKKGDLRAHAMIEVLSGLT